MLGQKEDGKKARARGSRVNAGTSVRRGIQRRIAQRGKVKEKATEEKEDGASAREPGTKAKAKGKDSKAVATSVANGDTWRRIAHGKRHGEWRRAGERSLRCGV